MTLYVLPEAAAETEVQEEGSASGFDLPLENLANGTRKPRFIRTAGGVFLGIKTRQEVEERLLQARLRVDGEWMCCDQ